MLIPTRHARDVAVRDDKRSEQGKMVKVHPLAGKCGEGPPLAPELWKWRAGNRLNDMYFTAPTGERFRSRTELNVYLASMTNPPPADSFIWRVTEEFLAKNQVACWDSKTPSKRQSEEESLEKKQGEGSSKKKTGKRKEVTNSAPDTGRKKVKLELSSPSQQPSVPEVRALPLHQPISEKEATKVADVVLTPSETLRPKLKATKKDKLDKDWEDHQFFARVIASKVSWKWLYDAEAASKFLAEAEKLKEKSDSEIADLRNILLHRSSDMNNISRYSNQVLRIFVQILRNVQPPSTMGKVELADLVVNWKCKKRHFWCLLETSRLAPPSQPSSSKADDSSLWARNDRGSIPTAQDKTNGVSIGGILAHGESGVRSDEFDSTSNEELQLEVTLRDIQETVRDIEETQLTPDQLDMSVDLNVEACTTVDDIPQGRLRPKEELEESRIVAVTPRPEQGVHGSEAEYSVQYTMSERFVILDRIRGSTGKGQSATYQQEHQTVKSARCAENVGSSGVDVSRAGDETSQTSQFASFPPNYRFPRESSVCWCKICSKDQSFCRGCMCCLCPDPVKPEDEWLAVRCSGCKHLCHIKCALENNIAGVVKDMNLDGELSCPSCSDKVDLWPFFERSFEWIRGADSKSRSADLEVLAVLVLRLLDGTENRKYTFFRSLVVELHDVTRKFAIQDLVRQLLLGIKEELHEPIHLDSNGMEVVEGAMEALRRKRAEIEPLFDTLGKAYERVVEQTRQIRMVQVSSKAKRGEDEHPKIAEDKASSALLAQKIDNQTKKAEQEFQKLLQFKPSMVKPNCPTLADIDSSMNAWLDAVRAQRRAVEAAETELHLLKVSQKKSNGK